jgi:hypothetical protein
LSVAGAEQADCGRKFWCATPMFVMVCADGLVVDEPLEGLAHFGLGQVPGSSGCRLK